MLTQDLFPGTPAFALRGRAGAEALRSSLAQPMWPMHRQLQDKAAALHWYLNRDHPYVDGNKRLAVAAMETFLYLNAASLIASDDEVRDLALGVADGSISLEECRSFVRERCVRLHWNVDQIERWAQRLPREAWPVVRAAVETDGPFGRVLRLHKSLDRFSALSADESESV